MLQDDANETERVPFLGPPLLATQNGCSVCLCCWRPFLLDAASILGMGTGMGPLLELVSKDSSRRVHQNYTISFFIYLHLMLHA